MPRTRTDSEPERAPAKAAAAAAHHDHRASELGNLKSRLLAHGHVSHWPCRCWHVLNARRRLPSPAGARRDSGPWAASGHYCCDL
jgi:hypothetical protein